MDVKGLEHCLATLEKVGANPREAVLEAATHLKKVAQTYPGTNQRKLADLGGPRLPGGFWSRRQQGWFFAALRAGEISVPYRRSGGLGRQWQIQLRSDGRGAIVSNETPGGVYVMGADKQSLYHAGNWKTETQIVRDESKAVLRIFGEHYRKAVQGR